MKIFILLSSLFIALTGFSQMNRLHISIVRDSFGVPHIFGKTDAETAYGLAWAHAEDDFKTIQTIALSGKGLLGKPMVKKGRRQIMWWLYCVAGKLWRKNLIRSPRNL